MKTFKKYIVTLLLDNSGSMRGKPIITSAITTEIITKVLEKCKVNVEVLGFTTREWKGGKSKKNGKSLGKLKIQEDLMIFFILFTKTPMFSGIIVKITWV